MAGVGSLSRLITWLASATIAMSMLVTTAATARAAEHDIAKPAALSAGRPAGFDDLMEPQQAIADLYYHGENIGQAKIWTSPGGMRFDDVDAVVARLPDVANRAAVRAVLARPLLDSHVGLVCETGTEEAATDCGRLRPDQTGVIFDQRHFRVDVFVAAEWLPVRSAADRQYLTPSSFAPAVVGFVSGTVAGSGGAHDQAYYNVQIRLIAGRGDARVRAESSYGAGYGAVVDTLVAELDRPGIRYSAGDMWVPGLDLTGRRKLLGAGLRSQLDTRLDRDLVIGSPLIVALLQRSRVDIIRDGRLVASRIYDAGNQTLDTGGLPDGAYQVTLRIQETGGSVQEERRFFTKNTSVPARGQSIFFAYGGVLVDDRPHRVFALTRTPYAQAGGARRLGDHLAIDMTAIATNRTLIAEAGGALLRSQDQIRLAALASVRGDVGVILQANSSGLSRLNYSIDARQIRASGNRPLLPVDQALRSPLDRSLPYGEVAIGSFAEASANVTYRIGFSQIGLSTSYRRYNAGERYYAIGPTANVPIVQRQGIQLFLRGDASISNRGKSVFLGLTFARAGARSSVTANAGMRSTGGTGTTDGTAAVGGIAASWQRDDVLGGELALAGGIDHEVGETVARGRVDLATRPASFYADVLKPLSHDPAGNGDTQYSANATTSFSIGGGRVVLDGRRHDDSMIIVSVDGAASSGPFEVIVDGAPRGTINADGHLAVSVAPYRRYAVRVKSTGDALVRLDGGVRQISVYPGTVARAAWQARSVLAMFGRLIWPDGSPVANAAITSGKEIAQSDEHGFFQIETTADAAVAARTGDGRTCDARLLGKTIASYRALGTIVCRSRMPTMVIASAGGE